MVFCFDLDETIYSFPKFFSEFINGLQKLGYKVGIMTANKERDKEANLKLLDKLSISPDFYIGKPDGFKGSNGIFKGKACKELNVDVLFDDFEASDDKMIADFFTVNDNTIPFTSWGYKNVVDTK